MRISTIIFLSFLPAFVFSQGKLKIDSINAINYTYFSNNLAKSKKLFTQNIADAKKINYPIGEAKSLNNLSTICSLLGEYDQAIQLNMDAIKIFEKEKQFYKVAQIYADLGFRIRYTDYKQGINYFWKAFQIVHKNKIKDNTSSIYNNYGSTIFDEKPDSAIYYFEKSLKICKIHKDSIGIPFSLNNLVVAYAKRKDFTKALDYMNTSDKYRMQSKDSAGISDNYAYRADLFYEIPQLDSALFYYKKSYQIAKRFKYNGLERFCLQRMSEINQKKGNFLQALLEFKLYKKLEDSALNIGVKNEIANLQIQFDSEKTKNDLTEEKLKFAKNEKRLEVRQKWLILLVSISVFLAILLYLSYRYQKSKRKNQIKAIELEQALEKTTLEKEFGEEKIRIARELHDNIGSHLTFMISSLDNLEYIPNSEEKLIKISNLSNFGRLTMKDLRDTIWAMNHDGGSFEELITRVSELRSVLPSTLFVTIHSEVKAQQLLNGLQLLNIYRIVQEFIQNTIKYANASKIDINFFLKNQILQIHVSDNGQGFQLNEINLGNGILNMKRRCEDLNGIFDIKSSEENGTKLSLEIPLNTHLNV